MGKQLTSYVHVTDDDGKSVVLKPGSEVPAWAKDQVTNAKAFEAEAEPVDPAAAPVAIGDMDKAGLQAEVARRNETREESDLIVVGGNGNKADLVEALEADDAKNQQ